jgi:hypothetical protein
VCDDVRVARRERVVNSDSTAHVPVSPVHCCHRNDRSGRHRSDFQSMAVMETLVSVSSVAGTLVLVAVLVRLIGGLSTGGAGFVAA